MPVAILLPAFTIGVNPAAVPIYVDGVNGSDANSGALGSPLKTLDAAITLANGRSGYQVIFLAAATYTPAQWVVLPDKCSLVGTAIGTVLGFDPAKVVLNCTAFTVSGSGQNFCLMPGNQSVVANLTLNGSRAQFGSLTGNFGTVAPVGFIDAILQPDSLRADPPPQSFFLRNCVFNGFVDGLYLQYSQAGTFTGEATDCVFSSNWDTVLTNSTGTGSNSNFVINFDFVRCTFNAIYDGSSQTMSNLNLNHSGTVRFFSCRAATRDAIRSSSSGKMGVIHAIGANTSATLPISVILNSTSLLADTPRASPSFVAPLYLDMRSQRTPGNVTVQGASYYDDTISKIAAGWTVTLPRN